MGIIFKTRGVIIFSNKLLNLIILLIFYFAILWLLSTIYYKLFKFETKKEILTKKEFKCFLMKKKAYKRKISKKENRIPIASLKKLEELNKEGEKLNNEFYKGGVFFKSYIVFLLFSIYYGTYLGLPIWAIKNSLKYFPKAVKDLFNTPFSQAEYFWDKIKTSSGEIEYHISYIPVTPYLKKHDV